MASQQRREKIIDILQVSPKAVSASALAEQLNVSRQIIVSDIALLRAKDFDILSTPRGYIFNQMHTENEYVFKVASTHSSDCVKQEIYAIVDNGGKLLDVMVEHPLYGQLIGKLNISSRFDANDFLDKLENKKINLLCQLTGGVHLHTISCSDKIIAERIIHALEELNILVNAD